MNDLCTLRKLVNTTKIMTTVTSQKQLGAMLYWLATNEDKQLTEQQLIKLAMAVQERVQE